MDRIDNSNHFDNDSEIIDECECSGIDGCMATGYQYAKIEVPIEIKPNVIVGKIETECCGEPVVCCKENHCKETCEIKITQKVCIKIPVHYSVTACPKESEIDCCNGCCIE